MNTYQLQITTPAGNIYDAQAYQLSLRAVDGDLAVLAGHTALCTAVLPCECRVYDENCDMRRATIGSGILNVSADKTQLLTSSFEWKE